jgi:hypothetical protein
LFRISPVRVARFVPSAITAEIFPVVQVIVPLLVITPPVIVPLFTSVMPPPISLPAPLTVSV